MRAPALGTTRRLLIKCDVLVLLPEKLIESSPIRLRQICESDDDDDVGNDDENDYGHWHA